MIVMSAHDDVLIRNFRTTDVADDVTGTHRITAQAHVNGYGISVHRKGCGRFRRVDRDHAIHDRTDTTEERIHYGVPDMDHRHTRPLLIGQGKGQGRRLHPREQGWPREAGNGELFPKAGRIDHQQGCGAAHLSVAHLLA